MSFRKTTLANRIILLHLLPIWLCISGARAFIPDIFPVELPAEHLRKIEKLVCLSPFNLKAEKIAGFKYGAASSSYDYAEVICKAHGEFKGSPIYYSTSCIFQAKKWSCDKPDLHIFVTLKNRKVDVIPGHITAELANDTIIKISSYGALRGRSIDEAIGNKCSIGAGLYPEELELNCTGYIKISFWCPQPEITHCPRVVDVQQIYD